MKYNKLFKEIMNETITPIKELNNGKSLTRTVEHYIDGKLISSENYPNVDEVIKFIHDNSLYSLSRIRSHLDLTEKYDWSLGPIGQADADQFTQYRFTGFPLHELESIFHISTDYYATKRHKK